MTVLLIAAVVIIALFAVVHAADLRKQRSVQTMMDGIVTRRGQDTLDELNLMVRENKYVIHAYHDHAVQLRGEGNYEKAAQRMHLGCRLVEELAPDFVKGLGALRRLARSVSVIVSVPPVRPAAFQTLELRSLAGLGAFVHHLLLTGKQQILLRLRIVASAFRLALRFLRRSMGRLTANPANLGDWRHVDAIVSDFGTANDEVMVTAVQIVQALDAAELGSPVVRRIGS